MRDINWLVLHTSATADESGKAVDASAAAMRGYHIEHNGWDDIGYHFVVRMSGEVERGRALDRVGAHCGGFNDESVGICLSGHGDLMPLTLAQRASALSLCADLCERFGLSAEAMIGHRETPRYGGPPVSKTCPGLLVNMDRLREQLRDVKLRHQRGPGLTRAQDSRVSKLSARVSELERRLRELEKRLPLPPIA